MATKTAMLRPLNPPQEGTDATVILSLSRMNNFTRLKLEIHEAAPEQEGSAATDKVIGTLTGCSLPCSDGTNTIVLDAEGGVTNDVPQPDDTPNRKRVIAVIVPVGGDSKRYLWKFFPIPDDVTHEGDADTRKRRHWFFYVKMVEPGVSYSNRVAMTVVPHAMGVGVQSTYDWHEGNQVEMYVHGTKSAGVGDPSAFEDLVAAIEDAKHFIFISDWSFHPYFRVKRDGSPLNKQTIGRLLTQKATQGVLVGILVWQPWSQGWCGIYQWMGAPQDEQSRLANERFLALNGNKPLPPKLLWRTANRTGKHLSHSHHQKFVVLDSKGSGSRRVLKAFFGGLDLTKGRFDSADHFIDPELPAAKDYQQEHYCPVEPKSPQGKKGVLGIQYDDWYSQEFQADAPKTIPAGDGKGSDQTMPREPWHDIYGSIAGPTAWDFLREWVGRWNNYNPGDRGDVAVAPPPADPNSEDDPSLDPPSTWPATDQTKMVNDLYHALHETLPIVQQFEPSPAGTDYPWSAQVVRSMVQECWETQRLNAPASAPKAFPRYGSDFRWSLAAPFERSIQDAYLNAIGLAEKFVYIETQYFISSADKWPDQGQQSNTIQNQLAAALCKRIEDKKGKTFHVYVIAPMYPEGTPDNDPAKTQRYFEWRTIEYMIQRIEKSCGTGTWKKYMSFFFPVRNGAPKGGAVLGQAWPPPGQLTSPGDVMFIDSDGTQTYGGSHSQPPSPNAMMMPAARSRNEKIRMNNRYMVYVHSKLMLIDDTYAIFGSANLNERSLSGNRDTEICVQMWPRNNESIATCRKLLKARRDHLFTEHFGKPTDDPKVAQAAGDQNYKSYAGGTPLVTSTSGQCVALPLELVNGRLHVKRANPDDDSTDYLFDAANNKQLWKWEAEEATWKPTSGSARLAAE